MSTLGNDLLRSLGEALAHAKGAWFHTDAVQAVGKVPFDVEALDVDFASLTAHKIYGPKGVGALYVRRNKRGVKLAAEIDGGGHERGLRSGTLNVPGIVGFGQAAEIARAELSPEARRTVALRDRLLNALLAMTDGMTVNGALDARLPGNLNVSFEGIDGEALLVGLDDIAVSSGAACTAAEPSHVLVALGLSTDRALASLRFGIGRAPDPVAGVRQNTMIEITESASRVINKQVAKNAQPGGGLRIAIKAGGCSGFSYAFTWDSASRDNDMVFEGAAGAKVFVDPRSLKLLDGTVLDFDEHNMMATTFTLKNPQATSTCGCGTSFSA